MVINRFDGPYHFMSNFYNSPIVFMGEEWKTVEHLFQAFKSREKPIRDAIGKLSTASDAKRAGRRATKRNDWDEIKIPIMKAAVRMKFMQHQDLAEKLIATGTMPLVEGNTWHDNDWGDCYCSDCHSIPGQNHLGKILMQVRDELREMKICQ